MERIASTLTVALALAGCDPARSEAESAPRDDATNAVHGATPTASAPPQTMTCSGCSDLERCDAGRCLPACPEGEVFVPPTGPDGFVMGNDNESNAKPHRVVLTRPFCIDATEVTAGAYAECVAAKACEEPRTWGLYSTYPKLVDHPVNKVHFKHAESYCAFRGKTLPTEAQWQWAATGGDDRKWPWGNEEPTCEHADFTPGVLRSGASDDGCHGGGTSPVGSHPAGDRIWPSGRIHDLAGNVWEWCRDNYLSFNEEPASDPLPLDRPEGMHVVRGGGWNRSAAGIRADFRGGAVVDYQVPALGFRCLRNPAASVSPPPER